MNNQRKLSEKIDAYLSLHREEIFGRLAALCRIPSIEGEAEDGKPFGAEVDRAIRTAVGFFTEEGFSGSVEHDGRFGTAVYGDGKTTIGLFGHADVVPAGGDWQVTRPFTPHREGGFFFARGCEDNKGGIIASLYAMKALRELSLPISSKILAFIGANEESGMADIAAFRERCPMPNASLVPDNHFPLSLGEKGRAEGWLVSPRGLSDILDFRGGECFNIVLDLVKVTLLYKDELYAELSGKHSPDFIYELEHDGERITLTFHGVAAHASRPRGSVNAAERAATLLASCEELSAGDRAVMAAASRLLSDPFGGSLGIGGEDGPFGERTAACGMVRVEGKALRLSADIRYGAAVFWQTLSQCLDKALIPFGWRFECGGASDGFLLSPNDPKTKALLSVYLEETGETAAAPYYSGGGTYARHLLNAYSIGLLYEKSGEEKTFPLPAGHGGAHQADECIGEDAYLYGIRLLVLMLLALDEAL